MPEVSVRGRVIRDMIAHVTNDNLIGRKIKTGELRKKLVELMRTVRLQDFTVRSAKGWTS